MNLGAAARNILGPANDSAVDELSPLASSLARLKQIGRLGDMDKLEGYGKFMDNPSEHYDARSAAAMMYLEDVYHFWYVNGGHPNVDFPRAFAALPTAFNIVINNPETALHSRRSWNRDHTLKDILEAVEADALIPLLAESPAKLSANEDVVAVLVGHDSFWNKASLASVEQITNRFIPELGAIAERGHSASASDVLVAAFSRYVALANEDEKARAEAREQGIHVPMEGRVLPRAQKAYAAYLQAVEALPEREQRQHNGTLAYHAGTLNPNIEMFVTKLLADMGRSSETAHAALRALDLVMPALHDGKRAIFRSPTLNLDIDRTLRTIADNQGVYDSSTRMRAMQFGIFWGTPRDAFQGKNASIGGRDSFLTPNDLTAADVDRHAPYYPLRTYTKLLIGSDDVSFQFRAVGISPPMEKGDLAKPRNPKNISYMSMSLAECIAADNRTRVHWQNEFDRRNHPNAQGPRFTRVFELANSAAQNEALQQNPVFENFYKQVVEAEASMRVSDAPHRRRQLINWLRMTGQLTS